MKLTPLTLGSNGQIKDTIERGVIKRYEPEIIIYTDGGGKSTGGPGSWAAAIITDAKDPRFRYFHYIYDKHPDTTNNRMELTAVIQAFNWVEHYIRFHKDEEVRRTLTAVKLTIFSDSEYCVKGFNDWIYGWIKKNWIGTSGIPVKNKDLWNEIVKIKMIFPGAMLQHIRGHNGNCMNEFVDRICTAVLKNNPLPEIPELKEILPLL